MHLQSIGFRSFFAISIKWNLKAFIGFSIALCFSICAIDYFRLILPWKMWSDFFSPVVYTVHHLLVFLFAPFKMDHWHINPNLFKHCAPTKTNRNKNADFIEHWKIAIGVFLSANQCMHSKIFRMYENQMLLDNPMNFASNFIVRRFFSLGINGNKYQHPKCRVNIFPNSWKWNLFWMPNQLFMD